MATKFDLIKLCFPSIKWEGVCFGVAQSGIFSLFTDLGNLTQRDEWIKYGIGKDPKNPQARVGFNDFAELVWQESLMKYVRDITIPDDKEMKVTSSAVNDEVMKELQKLIQSLDEKVTQADEKSNSQLMSDPSVYLGPIYPDVPEIEAADLKVQMDLAWRIREAYLEKLKEQPNSTPSYAEFLKKYPFIAQLNELAIYLANAAQIQEPKEFPAFFAEQGRPWLQVNISHAAHAALLAPVDLDGQVSMVREAEFGCTLTLLQATLESLASKVDSSLAHHRQSAHMDQTARFQLAIAINANLHETTLGYDQNVKQWVRIDANAPYPQLVRRDQIAREVLEAHIILPKVRLTGEKTTLHFAYNKTQKQFILLSAEKKADSEKQTVSENSIQALMRSPQVKKMTDISMQMKFSCFAPAAQAQEMQNLVDLWVNGVSDAAWQDAKSQPAAANPTESKLALYGVDDHLGPRLTQKELSNPDITDVTIFARNCRDVGSLEFAEKLIQAGFDINNRDEKLSYNDAMCFACRYGRKDIVNLLLKAGAHHANFMEAVNSGILDAALTSQFKTCGYWRDDLAHSIECFAYRGDIAALKKLIDATMDLHSIKTVIQRVASQNRGDYSLPVMQTLIKAKEYFDDNYLKFGLLSITKGTQETLLQDVAKLIAAPDENLARLCDEFMTAFGFRVQDNILSIEQEIQFMPAVSNLFAFLKQQYPQNEYAETIKTVQEQLLYQLRQSHIKRDKGLLALRADANNKLLQFRLHSAEHQSDICKWLGYRLQHVPCSISLGAAELKQLHAMRDDKNSESGFVKMVMRMTDIPAANVNKRKNTFFLFQSSKENNFANCLAGLNQDLAKVLALQLATKHVKEQKEFKEDEEFCAAKLMFEEFEQAAKKLEQSPYAKKLTQAAADFQRFMQLKFCTPAEALQGLLNQYKLVMQAAGTDKKAQANLKQLEPVIKKINEVSIKQRAVRAP